MKYRPSRPPVDFGDFGAHQFVVSPLVHVNLLVSVSPSALIALWQIVLVLADRHRTLDDSAPKPNSAQEYANFVASQLLEAGGDAALRVKSSY
jgi:hypothetical protein